MTTKIFHFIIAINSTIQTSLTKIFTKSGGKRSLNVNTFLRLNLLVNHLRKKTLNASQTVRVTTRTLFTRRCCNNIVLLLSLSFSLSLSLSLSHVRAHDTPIVARGKLSICYARARALRPGAFTFTLQL